MGVWHEEAGPVQAGGQFVNIIPHIPAADSRAPSPMWSRYHTDTFMKIGKVRRRRLAVINCLEFTEEKRGNQATFHAWR